MTCLLCVTGHKFPISVTTLAGTKAGDGIARVTLPGTVNNAAATVPSPSAPRPHSATSLPQSTSLTLVANPTGGHRSQAHLAYPPAEDIRRTQVTAKTFTPPMSQPTAEQQAA